MNPLLPDPNLKLLTGPKAMVNVTTAVRPLHSGRVLRQVEAGRSVLSVVEEICPWEYRGGLTVSIDGELLDEPEWADVVVMPQNVVVLRAVPQGGGSKILRSILMLAVVVAAFAILGPMGGFTAGGLLAAGGTAATIAWGVAFAVINAVGNLLINALIPPPSIGNDGAASTTQTYGLSGIQNVERQYASVPRIFGRTLMTPPKGAHSYTVSNNNNTILYALFDLGPGPIQITDLNIGNTPIDDFLEVEYETREGRDSDDPITLFTNSVNQSQLSIGLNAGATSTQRSPLVVTHVEVDIAAPSGIFALDAQGNFQSNTQTILVEVKDLGGSVVQSQTFNIVGQGQDAIAQTLTMPDIAPGQYDINVTRTTNAPDSKKGSARLYWTALRTWKPIDPDVPLIPQNHAKIAVKIKANEQLNGDIQTLNCIAQAYVQVWNGTSFTEELNTHPAWAFSTVLRESNRPLDVERIDMDMLKEWADTYPSAEFNYVFSERTTIWQALRTICPAGRALPVIRDGLYSVIFDRVQDTPVQLFTAKNINGFKATKTFFDEIHGMEIRYIAETMGWQQDSVYVYADGITADNADPTKISPLNLTGVTSDEWAYWLGSYFFAASILRPTIYQFGTSLDHLACNPGDRIKVQHDVIGAGLIAGRIKSIVRDGSGSLISLDLNESFAGDGVSTYLMEVRTAAGTIYTIPITVPGTEGHTFTPLTHFDDSADRIEVDDLVAVASTVVQTLDAIVKTISPQSDFMATVTCFDYAPTIHSGDGVTPPPRTNDRNQNFVYAPPTQSAVIDFLTADETTTLIGGNNVVMARMHGFFHVNNDGTTADTFNLQYQIDGDIGWQPIPDLAGDSRDFFVPISFNQVGKTFNVRIRGNSYSGKRPSNWYNASLTITDYNLQPFAPTLVLTPIITGVSAAITPGGYDTVAAYRLYAGTTGGFDDSEMVASGPSSPLQVTGLKPNVPYLFWATTVNGLGVESLPSDVAAAIGLPVGIDDLAEDLQEFQDFVSDSLRDMHDAVSDLSQALAMVGLGNASDVQTLRREITSAVSSATSSFSEQITVATGETEALAQDVTSLSSALGPLTGPHAVSDAIVLLQTETTQNGDDITTQAQAIISLQSSLTGQINGLSNAVFDLTTSVSNIGGEVTAQADLIAALAAEVGDNTASGLFRVSARATPSGADASIQLSVAASSGGTTYAAALFLDAMSGGTSRVSIVADKIFFTDGSSTHNPFFISGGTLYADGITVQNLNAANITAGLIVTGQLSGSAATDDLNNSTGSTYVAPSTSGSPTVYGSWVTIAAVTVTQVNSYSPILISGFGTFSRTGGNAFGAQGNFDVRVLRDGSQIYELIGYGGANPLYTIGDWTFSLTDPGAASGSRAYVVQMATNDYGVTGVSPDTFGSTGTNTYSSSASLTVVSFKR